MNESNNTTVSEPVPTDTETIDNITGQSTVSTDADTSSDTGSDTSVDVPSDAVVDTDSTQDDVPQDSLEDTPVADTESDTTTEETTDSNTEESADTVAEETADGGTASGNDTGGTDIDTSVPSVDYTTELTSIRDMLGAQLNEMNAVQSISGNSVMVSLEDNVQLAQIADNQSVIMNLLACILLAVTVPYLVNSSKRIIKNITTRKGM